jgi:hypothetical protein
MVQEHLYWSSEATTRLWAEAWGILACLLVFFFLVVGHLLGASVLGIVARNYD